MRTRVSGRLCAVTDESAGYTTLRRCIPCRLGKGEGRDGVEALRMDLLHGGGDFAPHPGAARCHLLPCGAGESPAAAWRIERAGQLVIVWVFRALLPPHPGPLPWRRGRI